MEKLLSQDRRMCVMLFLLVILSLFATHESHSRQWIKMSSGTVEWLSGVWGSSASDIFAVGERGTILHYDGNRWSELNTGFSGEFLDFSAVWGSSANDVFVVGNLGKIIHYDGNQWSQMSLPYAKNLPSFRDIWGFSGSDVFVVGMGPGFEEGGLIFHYDGNQWTKVYDGGYEYEIFCSVWGSSASDIIIGGYDLPVDNSFIAHYNGITVSTMLFGGRSIPSSGIWGSSGSDVFAVGGWSQGRIYHYNGSSWSEMSQSPFSNYFVSVWGSSASNVYAVGDSGMILHYDGNQWTQMNSGISERLNDVWGFAGGDVFAVGDGGTILRYLEYSSICECDFGPDGDVDGADLADYVLDSAGISLNVFAGEFGRKNCF